MTKEERKIKRLESQLDAVKDKVKQLEGEVSHYKYAATREREWRMDFQKLIKAAAQDDFLTEYQPGSRWYP